MTQTRRITRTTNISALPTANHLKRMLEERGHIDNTIVIWFIQTSSGNNIGKNIQMRLMIVYGGMWIAIILWLTYVLCIAQHTKYRHRNGSVHGPYFTARIWKAISPHMELSLALCGARSPFDKKCNSFHFFLLFALVFFPFRSKWKHFNYNVSVFFFVCTYVLSMGFESFCAIYHWVAIAYYVIVKHLEQCCFGILLLFSRPVFPSAFLSLVVTSQYSKQRNIF